MSINVEKPVKRSNLRRRLGKEYYILRRRLKWMFGASSYVSRPGKSPAVATSHSIKTHRSMILRPLKDVDMELQHNKRTNLQLAIARIDGVVIPPGKTFSLWRLVGRPTRRKGYLDGLVIHNGEIGRGVGGGLCQLGNLLYWMALHSDLDITERWRHSFDVFPDVNRTIPFACGATLGYNYLDLCITNNTQDTYSFHLWLDDTHLCGEIRRDRASDCLFEVYETDHAIVQQWWGGYTRHNKIWKRRTDLQSGTSQEIPVSENHAIMMYNPLLPE